MFIDSNIKKVWFTADTHFGHKNVIKYCNRPYEDVYKMNNSIIDNWNSVVGKEDIVFHLGDFAFVKDATDIVRMLNGNIMLIPGNHDNSKNGHVDGAKLHTFDSSGSISKFNILPELFEVDIQVEDEKIRFVLCHYPMRVWNKSHHGAIHLFGHCHGTLPDDPTSLSMDVGVDCNAYTPISLDEVLLNMYKKTFKPVDHHGERK